jgi:hypothetical protein
MTAMRYPLSAVLGSGVCLRFASQVPFGLPRGVRGRIRPME